MDSKRSGNDEISSLSKAVAERRNALALVRLLHYAAAEAQELALPKTAAKVVNAAVDVTNAFGLTEDEIKGFPTYTI